MKTNALMEELKANSISVIARRGLECLAQSDEARLFGTEFRKPKKLLGHYENFGFARSHQYFSV